MDILAVSVWLRYLELFKMDVDFPSNGYKGTYVKNIALEVKDRFSNTLVHPVKTVFADIPQDEIEPGQGDKEAHIDGLILKSQIIIRTRTLSTDFSAEL